MQLRHAQKEIYMLILEMPILEKKKISFLLNGLPNLITPVPLYSAR